MGIDVTLNSCLHIVSDPFMSRDQWPDESSDRVTINQLDIFVP